MALKDLLVYADKTHDALHRLGLAANLADRHGSRLTALYVREWSQSQQHERKTAELGLVSSADLGRMDQRIGVSNDHAEDELRAAFEVLGREHGLTTEWRAVDGPAANVVPQHARYADLCVLGHYAMSDGEPDSYTFSERLLFSSGRPVLSIPTDPSFRTLGRHIAIAWNSSRASARAVNDALPLIECAERITLLTINPDDFIGRNGGLPSDAMVEHLQRHGAPTELIQLEHVATKSIANTLQDKARGLGADLLVAGAFGHPRLWERLLGGTTRDLLDCMRLPIMMSS